MLMEGKWHLKNPSIFVTLKKPMNSMKTALANGNI